MRCTHCNFSFPPLRAGQAVIVIRVNIFIVRIETDVSLDSLLQSVRCYLLFFFFSPVKGSEGVEA